MEEETKNLIAQFYYQQLQAKQIKDTISELKTQILIIDKALEELEKTKEKKAFKIVGPLMILKPVEELKKELKEFKEDVELRIESLEKSEKSISEKLKSLEKEIKEKVRK